MRCDSNPSRPGGMSCYTLPFKCNTTTSLYLHGEREANIDDDDQHNLIGGFSLVYPVTVILTGRFPISRELREHNRLKSDPPRLLPWSTSN